MQLGSLLSQVGLKISNSCLNIELLGVNSVMMMVLGKLLSNCSQHCLSEGGGVFSFVSMPEVRLVMVGHVEVTSSFVVGGPLGMSMTALSM